MGGGQSRAAKQLRDRLAQAAETGDLVQLRDALSQITDARAGVAGSGRGAEALRAVDLNSPVRGNLTLLQLAAREGHPRIVRHLLDIGVEPNRANDHTITPLHYSCEKQAPQWFGSDQDRAEVITALLRGNADPCLVSSDGLTALDMARAARSVVAVRTLQEPLTVWRGCVEVWEAFPPKWVSRLVVVHLDRRPNSGPKAQASLSCQCPTCGSYQTPPANVAQFTCTVVPSLRQGQRVRLSGLTAAAHLNGSIGTLESLDQGTGRWCVGLVDMPGVVLQALLPMNLHPQPCETPIMVCPSLQLAMYESEYEEVAGKPPCLVPLPVSKELLAIQRVEDVRKGGAKRLLSSVKRAFQGSQESEQKFGLSCKIMAARGSKIVKEVSFRFSTEKELMQLETVLQTSSLQQWSAPPAVSCAAQAPLAVPSPQASESLTPQPAPSIPSAPPKGEGVALGSDRSALCADNPSEEDDSLESNQCTVCMDNPSDSAVVPCGHMCGCHACLEKIRTSPLPHCPLCRGPVTSVVRIYR